MLAIVTSLLLLVQSTPAPVAPMVTEMDLASGRPVVALMINGEGPFPFIFDTGAGPLTLSSGLAEELGLTVTGQTTLDSPAGGEPVAVDQTRVESISLGGAGLSGMDALIVDFGPPGQLGAMGVIGPNAFRDYGRVAYDFANHRIEIGGPLRHDGDARWIDFSASAPLLEVPLTIGDVTVPAHIDTGNPSIMNFPEDRIGDLPLAGPLQVVGQARTIDRVMEIRGAPVEADAQIGDAVIPLTDITSFPLPFANIGSGALRGLYLEIDWQSERVAISGRAEPVSPRRRVVRRTAPEE